MFQWNTFFQQISGALFLMIVGGLWAMYVRVMGHSSKIEELQKEVANQAGKQDMLDQRLREIEKTTIRIDTNVTELLRTQRNESPRRMETRSEGG